MTPSEFEFKLNNLPPETLLTKEHLLAIVEVFKNTQVPTDSSYSSWDKDKLIDDKSLADWTGISTSTLQKWRTNGGGDGPRYVDMPRRSMYRVGDVRDWLNKRTVTSVAEASMKKAKGWKFMSDIGAGQSFSFNSLLPTIYIDGKPRDLFDSLAVDEQDKVTGYDLKWIEEDSVAEKFLTLLHQVAPIDLYDELMKLHEDGIDLDKPTAIYIEGELYNWTLPHLLAALPYSEDYASVVENVCDVGFDFNVKDSQFMTPVEVAEKYGNTVLPEMVDRFNRFEKLNKLINPKG